MRFFLITSVVIVFLWMSGHRAVALTACSANDIINQEANCPAAGDCTISKQYTIAGGCTLDFSGRNVTLAPSAVLAIGPGTVTLLTRDLVLAASASSAAYIDGRGTGTSPPANQGRTVIINASGDVSIQKNGTPRARIDVSATEDSGLIQITAAGGVNVAGRLAANPALNAANVSGGRIRVEAGGDIVTGAGSQIRAGTEPGELVSGGLRIHLSAGGNIDLGTVIDVSGETGGNIALEAGEDIVVRGIAGSGTRGDAGELWIRAGHGVQLLASPIYLIGNGTAGAGGNVYIEAQEGDLRIEASVLAESRGTMEGREITGMLIRVAGDVTVAAGARLSTHGYRHFGGPIELHTGGALVMAGTIDVVGGGPEGGYVYIRVGGDATISGSINASSESRFGRVYEIGIEAGGDLLVSSVLNCSGGGCYGAQYCSEGGFISLRGRNVTLTRRAQLLAHGAGSGGVNEITAEEVLVIDGVLDSRLYGSAPSDFTGANYLYASCATIRGTIRPPAERVPEPCLPSPTNTPIRTPSPTSTVTRTFSPVATATRTPTRTVPSQLTQAATRTSTASNSPVSSPTETATSPVTPVTSVSSTPLHTPTSTTVPTSTVTRTFSPVATATGTPTRTVPSQPTEAATRTSTASNSPVSSPTETATSLVTPVPSVSPTPLHTLRNTPSPTSTAVPRHPGDQNCDSTLSAADLSGIVQMLLSGESGPCGGDVTGDGVVDEDDIDALIGQLFGDATETIEWNPSSDGVSYRDARQ